MTSSDDQCAFSECLFQAFFASSHTLAADYEVGDCIIGEGLQFLRAAYPFLCYPAPSGFLLKAGCGDFIPSHVQYWGYGEASGGEGPSLAFQCANGHDWQSEGHGQTLGHAQADSQCAEPTGAGGNGDSSEGGMTSSALEHPLDGWEQFLGMVLGRVPRKAADDSIRVAQRDSGVPGGSVNGEQQTDQAPGSTLARVSNLCSAAARCA